MKWIRQYRLSSALDAGKPSSPSQQASVDSPELEEFARAMGKLDERLKAEKPGAESPPFLHNAIMARVRASEQQSYSNGALWRWWAAPAGAALLIACFLGLVYFARQAAHTLPAPKPQQEVAAVPGKVLSPLSTEMDKLQLDLERTARFLVASVPEMDDLKPEF